MTTEDLSFVFHVNTPNNEDVEPVLYNGWLAVADGMGGAGCTKHRVDSRFRSSLADVLRYVLPEYAAKIGDPRYRALQRFVEGDAAEGPSYFERIFAPCIEDECNTSARWASRIAMARFLFYVIAADAEGKAEFGSREYIEDLGEFIRRGLEETKLRLGLTVCNPDLSVLPTTFAAVHCSGLNEEECLVRAVWAGDSRCYVLNADGLKKLSADDEDENKLLTNHFSADADVELHCRTYRMKKPFVLIGASDGFFDAYDKTGLTVEARLLYNIFEASSAAKLREALVERYKQNFADDTSVAFVPVGFSGYDQIKALLSERYRKIGELFGKHRQYASIISLIDKPEHQATASVCDRFESRFGDVVRALVEAHYAGKEDILLTQFWENAISQCEAECERELGAHLRERREKLKEQVLKSIEAEGASVFRRKIHFTGGIADHVAHFRECCKNLEKIRAKKSAFEQNEALLNRELREIQEEIWSEQRRQLTELSASLADSENNAIDSSRRSDESKRRCAITFLLNQLSRIEYFAYNANYDLGGKDRNGAYKKIIRRIEGYRRRCGEYEGELRGLEDRIFAAERDARSAFKKLRLHADLLLRYRKEIFAADFINKYDMDNIVNGLIGREERCRFVEDRLAERFGKDAAVIRATLDVFRQNPTATSCADGIFPAAKLSDFRTYYFYRDRAGCAEFVQYRRELETYERETDLCSEEPLTEISPAGK